MYLQYMYIYIHTCAYMYICTHIYIHILSIYIYIHNRYVYIVCAFVSQESKSEYSIIAKEVVQLEMGRVNRIVFSYCNNYDR